MIIATRGRHAVRIAIHGRSTSVLRRARAERQDILTDYIAQILKKPRNAGIATFARRPGDGHKLEPNRDPHQQQRVATQSPAPDEDEKGNE